MEYEQHADGTLTPLPKQNIDTGLGLERGAAILQDVRSVYETDGYRQIMDWIASESGVAYGDSAAATKAHRILADHGRGMTFLVGDGVTPSNEGRGYVLRRIIRRAVQQAQRIGLHDVHRCLGGRRRADGRRVSRSSRSTRRRSSASCDSRRSASSRRSSAGSSSSRSSARRRRSPASRRSRSPRPTGSRSSSPSSSPRSAARRSTSTATASRWSATARSRARAAPSELQRAVDFARAADFTTEFVGYAKTDVLTQIGALEELDDGLFLAKLRESPFYPAGGGQVTDAGTIELDDDSGTVAELVDAYRLERRPGARSSAGRASRRATACAPACRGRCASRRWRTTRGRTCCTRRFATCSASTCVRRARR